MKLFFSLGVLMFSSSVYTAQALFSDQSSIPDWSNASIQALVNKGVLSGNDDGSFSPEREMNRVEFAKLIVNATGVTKYLPLSSNFPDIERGDWFFDYVETAKKYGWVSGYPDGYFRPAGKINRAEVAKIISIAFGLEIPDIQPGQEWSVPYFKALENANLLAYGVDAQNLNAGQAPSRAELSEQIYRIMKYTGKISAYDEPAVIETPLESTFVPQQEDTTPSPSEEVFTNPTYQYTEEIESTIPVSVNAGDIYIEKRSGLPRRVTELKGTQNVLAHAIKLRSQNGNAKVVGFTFKRVGAGTISDFKRAWLEMGDQQISNKVTLTEDTFYLSLLNDLTIGSIQKEIVLRVDLGNISSQNKSSRFVLYLPDWIDANTDSKIGFFPLGGVDIIVQ